MSPPMLLAMLLVVGSASAHDSVTVPTAQYLAHVMGREPRVALPIVTPGMRPMRLMGSPTLNISDWMTQPVFVVGDDPSSRRWLVKNRDFLSHLGASGLLVQVRTQKGVKEMVELGQGLPLMPVSSTWLAIRLEEVHAAVLPILILSDGSIVQDIDADARMK